MATAEPCTALETAQKLVSEFQLYDIPEGGFRDSDVALPYEVNSTVMARILQDCTNYDELRSCLAKAATVCREQHPYPWCPDPDSGPCPREQEAYAILRLRAHEVTAGAYKAWYQDTFGAIPPLAFP
jgi:hypothetical protein